MLAYWEKTDQWRTKRQELGIKEGTGNIDYETEGAAVSGMAHLRGCGTWWSGRGLGRVDVTLGHTPVDGSR